MKRIILVVVALFGVFTLLYLAADALGWMDPETLRSLLDGLARSGWGRPAVAGGIAGLLAVDLLLPVPSSVVMTLAGVLLGFWAGLATSLVGGVVGGALG